MMTDEIRVEIAGHAGIETDRYVTPSERRFTKAHLQQISTELGCDVEDMTLREIYWAVCRTVGVEYNSTAGCQWGLGRTQLKAILRELRNSEPEPEVAYA